MFLYDKGLYFLFFLFSRQGVVAFAPFGQIGSQGEL